MTQAAPTNNGSVRWRAARIRLFRGYAPLVIFVAAFALITTLTPTVAPDKDTVTLRETPSASTGGAAGAAAGNAGTATTGATAGTGAAAGSSGAASTGATKTTTGTAAAAASGGCPGQALQVPADPYSPPCVAFSGSNGGGTSPGVTASTINISYRVTADFASLQSSFGNLSAAAPATSVADLERTYQGMVTYFNDHYQFYGRKLKLTFFNGQGTFANELQGQGQAQADADALTSAQQIGAFAELDGDDDVYANALAQQKVVTVVAADLADASMTADAPYLWSQIPTCTQYISAVMDFVAKQLANKPATYAGGSLKGQPRKFALIAPENPNYQICANQAVALAKAAGFTINDDLNYDVDASTLATQDDELVAKMANDGDTSVILLTDALSPLLLSDRADEQGYFPEWIESGVASLDADASGQVYQQAEWNHAFGVSFLGPTVPLQQSLGYAAYTSVEPDQPAISQASNAFQALQLLAIGIQMAGPDLTPQTFAKGMFAYPGSATSGPNLNFGAWKFTPASYASGTSAWAIYYNPNAHSTQDGQTGAYTVASPAYPVGGFPTGTPAFPAGFPFAPPAS
ncbi:MAG TPA: hypothetical protein VHV57_15750 [Acidimicrobiales bacterium]|jgi:hypothetical protein|nr:hypothetical protein [Acidimicrobiales bacterium]